MGVTSLASLPYVSSLSGTPALNFNRNLNATDISIFVQATNDLAGSWTDLASSTGGAAMTPLLSGVTASETAVSGSISAVQVSNLYWNQNSSTPSRYFMRLKIIK